MKNLTVTVCKECNGDCSPFPVSHRLNIRASEWYCKKCHKSYPMDKQTAEYFLMRESQR